MWPEEVLMTLTPAFFAVLLSNCLPFFPSNILWWKANVHNFLTAYCVWGARGIHNLSSPCFPCSTVTYFWAAIFDSFLLPTCWWRMGLWATDACLKTHPFLGPLNWQSLYLRDAMKTNGHRQATVNGASWTSFCPSWSAIMSVTIWQFIWAAPLQMMSVLGRHNVCFLLAFCRKVVEVLQFEISFLFSECVSKSCSWSQLTSKQPRCSVMITDWLDWLWNVERGGGHLQRYTDMARLIESWMKERRDREVCGHVYG